MDMNELEGTARDLKGHVKDAAGGLTGDVGTQAEGKVDQLAGHAQSAFGTASDTARDAASQASEKVTAFASRAGSVLSDTADTVRAQAGDAGAKIVDAGKQAGEYVGQTVQEQPLLSLIGVAALGYLLGFLVHSVASPFAAPPPPRRYGWR